MNIEKVEKLASNLHDTKEYVMYIRILKQALLNHGLVLKKTEYIHQIQQKHCAKIVP